MSFPVATIDVAGLASPLPDSLHVLDVREHDEWDAGHIAGAQHIPLGELAARLAEVPTDQKILCVCHVGGRSAQATMFLDRQGRDVVNLAGGMEAWAVAGRPVAAD